MCGRVYMKKPQRISIISLYLIIPAFFVSCHSGKPGQSYVTTDAPISINSQQQDERLLKKIDESEQSNRFRFATDNQNAINSNMIYLKKTLKKSATDAQIAKIAEYLAYIKLTPDLPYYNNTVSRLLSSSLQFILCDDVADIACVEKKPEIDPRSKNRIDTLSDLGKPILAGDKLDIQFYFTQGWYQNLGKKSSEYTVPENTVAKELGRKIKQEGTKSVLMAIYGIDDINDSMKDVFEAIKEQSSKKVDMRAVLDVSYELKPNSFIRGYDIEKNENGKYRITNAKSDLDYSYFDTKNEYWAFGSPRWMNDYLQETLSLVKENNISKGNIKNFMTSQVIENNPEYKGNQNIATLDAIWLTINRTLEDIGRITRMSFEYGNSIDLIRLLNNGIKSNEESRARIEFPFASIMHNKFMIFENKKGEKSVWTGTANISKTCMGNEANANLAIFIKNNLIAETFKTEFYEMYSPSKDTSTPATLLTGKFHNKKTVNTNRYFSFKDGTEVRVHFSPTDDAEHRVILPLIYSAKTGDVIRISMFGSAGYELVRAFQSAVARGVEVYIAIDSLSGANVGSWTKSTSANLFEKNPFNHNPKGLVEIRKNTWNGLNHHKTATLSRRQKDGTYKAETITIGSQNWSTSGNDLNDENVVTITNRSKALKIMDAFNREFDEKIWPSSIPVQPGEPAVLGELPADAS